MRCKACLDECTHGNRNFFRYAISSLNKHFILSRHFFIMQSLRKQLLTNITHKEYYERET